MPNYNPADIVTNLRRKMAGEEQLPIHPWYRGFRGTIEQIDKNSYSCGGLVEQLDDSTIEITELPIRVWTQSHKEMLEGMVAGSEKSPALIKDYKEYHTDTTVHFVVTLSEKGKDAVKREGLEKVFKMTAKINISNMVMFDPQGKIKKYTSPEEVVDDFYDVRLDYYHRRKAFVVNELTNQHDKLSNQARFIQMIIKKELVLNNRKKAAIVAELRDKDFRPFPKVAKAQVVGGGADEGVEEEEVEDAEGGLDSDYDYLLSMALSSLTSEKVDKLMKERDEKEDELTALLRLSATDLWSADLDEFSARWEVSRWPADRASTSPRVCFSVADASWCAHLQNFVENEGKAQAKGLREAKAKASGKGGKKAKALNSDSDS